MGDKMVYKHVGFFQYKKIIKEANNFIYHDKKTGRMIKLDKDCAGEMKNRNTVSIFAPKIDLVQISDLSSKQIHVNHSHLPSGIMYYNELPVGVIYPYYFDGYKTFEELYKEDSDLMLDNIRKAYYYNLELVNNDICNKDFVFKNIMYDGSDVQLIDLDGKLVGNKYNTSYSQMYSYLLRDFYHSIIHKLELLGGKIDDSLLQEIKTLFNEHIDNIEKDSPIKIVEEIERKRILK